MKPRIYKVRRDDYLWKYHDRLPWVLEMGESVCPCRSWEECIHYLYELYPYPHGYEVDR